MMIGLASWTCHYHVLSTSGDTKVVMKGISNGACDYLLKPVPVEQLKLIWQHVFRRRTQDSKTSSFALPACCCASGGRLSTRKRRKQNDDNKDLSTTKSSPTRQKAVLSMEMWRKFRAAVHQLGSVNKVEPEPEKIVDLMNVEGRTRKNEASQIQHYRLYLRARANAMTAFRASHSSSYLPMVDRCCCTRKDSRVDESAKAYNPSAVAEAACSRNANQ